MPLLPVWMRRRSDLYNIPADVIVYRDGEYAIAIDGKTKRVIARSSEHDTVIQEAIDYLENGGKIYISQGTYNIKNTITLKNNIILEGAGKSTILQNSVERPNYLNPMISANDNENIIIRDIYFDGNLRNLGTTGGYYEGAIILAGVKYALIMNCEFYDWYSNPIDIINTDTNNPYMISVVNNIIHYHNGDAGIRTKYTNLCIIAENKIENGNGIYLNEYSYNNVVINNVINTNHGGTNIDGGDYGDVGISLYNANDNIIIGNVIYNAKIDTSGNGGIGILLNASNNNIITGNKIINCEASAISIINSSVNYIALNYLRDNCLQSTANDRDEIKVYASSDQYSNVIENNVILETGGQKCRYGIYIDSYQHNCVIRFNKIFDISPAIVNNGVNTKIKSNIGYTTENYGTATFTGDGTTTQFTISHGLVSTPTVVIVTPKGSTPKPDSIDWDSTTIYINYSTAPTAGTTLTFSWYASV